MVEGLGSRLWGPGFKLQCAGIGIGIGNED